VPFKRDYSRESLEQLEQFVLDRWPTQDGFIEESDTDFIDGAVRYIGETLLRPYGGGWHLNDDPQFDSNNRPYLRLDTLDRTPVTPFFLLTALLKRRTGSVLTRVLMHRAGTSRSAASKRAQAGSRNGIRFRASHHNFSLGRAL